MKKEHVILICADQLRYDVLGKGYTPHLDSLAAQSIRYQDAYCASPLCVPARGSLFTGLYPNSTGSLINPWEAEDAKAGYVKEGIDNLYDIMSRNGWDCLHSGKQHLLTEGGKLENRPDTLVRWLSTDKTYRAYLSEHKKRMPGGSSFRSVVPEMISRSKTILTSCSNASTGCFEEGESYYFDTYFTDRLIEGLKNRDTMKPLFLSAMYLAPHPPFDIPDPWFSKYTREDVLLPDNVGNFYPHQSPLQLYNVTGILGSHYTRKEWQESWRVYLGLVTYLDHCIGRVISELREQGIYDKSLVIFTSDHGEMLGSHGLFQKMCMYQESVKVPFMIKLPYADQGNDIYDSVSHIDLLPTLCDYLEMTPRHPMQGRLLPGIKDVQDSCLKDPVFIQYDGNGSLGSCQRCILDHHMKLILDRYKDEVYFELYNIQKDPEEKENLLFDPTQCDRADPLYDLLARHLEATGDSYYYPQSLLADFKKKWNITNKREI